MRGTFFEQVRAGDTVLVSPGTLVPVDGIVIKGHSFEDQARTTGEWAPVKKVAGSAVYAGTINQTGACGIAVGTPLALLGDIGQAARLGVIIKGGKYLETLGQISTGVLDETGTLTCRSTEVQTVLPAPYITEKEVIEGAARRLMRSEHPVGKAIVAQAVAAGLWLSNSS